MHFPRLVYMSAAVHQAVNNPTEYAAAIKAGYYGSVPEALAKAHAPITEPAGVTVYKNGQRFKAADQAAADAMIAGDGWYLTEDDATRAAWPTQGQIPAAMADLAKRPADAIRAAGAQIGVLFKEGTKPAEMLKSIEARLMTGPDAPK